ncbi:DUF1641 domain-containing protein [Deinococcus yavapaiensis]|uniref:Uncharacterized protein YjgD (DUF1641 family) n=1 Tax=Deinococcus yavapaiensis KR-236 TaxID=694435 RepID=A0A318S8I7_9DEIO|nr:DUF1641 domain-containing protein [Deinococcus yavapaiensis]PYE51942.1 uncharacterized protein YjgD (DUF1641 family) [Deinococcus yavapaiensis KR-236]
MAKSLKFDAAALQATPRERLEEETHLSADALLDALNLVRALHEHRVLDTTARLVQGGAGLSHEVLELLNQPGGVRALRNLLEFAKLLGSVEPDEVGAFTGALADGLRAGANRVRSGQPIGTRELLSLTRDPDVGLALGVVADVLKGVGRGLRERAQYGDVHVPPQT